jgi:hypothetical protein
MSPSAEQTYLSQHKSKTITYTDFYQFKIPSITTGSTISQLLTNGIINPRSIVIYPVINSTSNVNSVSPIASVFASEPGTTSPLAVIQDFNIQLAGVNMFMINETYEWQQFLDELQAPHSLNGGLVTGLTSGLITEWDWTNNQHWYVCNLARRLSAEDSIPKSVLVLGKNLTELTMDYYAFIECERSVTVSLVDGQLLA